MRLVLRLSVVLLAALCVCSEKCNTDEDCGSVTRYRLCKSGSCEDCSKNNDCKINEGDECTNDGHCEMLSFFGNMGVREVFAMITVAVGAVIAAGGGLGGGGIFVPVFILILGFNTKAAAALSQATIFGGSLVNLYMNFKVNHPIRPHRTLADLNTILILEPMLLAGTVIGVILNLLLPAPLILVCLVIVLSYSAKRTWLKGWKMWQKETHLSQRALKQEQQREQVQSRTVRIGGDNQDIKLDLDPDLDADDDVAESMLNSNNNKNLKKKIKNESKVKPDSKGQFAVESSSSGDDDEEHGDPMIHKDTQSFASARAHESFAEQMELESNSDSGKDEETNEQRQQQQQQKQTSNKKSMTPDSNDKDKSISLIEEERNSAELNSVARLNDRPRPASLDLSAVPVALEQRVQRLTDLCGGSESEAKAVAAASTNSPSSVQSGQQDYGSNQGSTMTRIRRDIQQLKDDELNDLESLMDDEASRLKPMIFVCLVWCIVFVFAVMKRGLLFPVSGCGGDAWTLQFASFPLLIAVTLYISRRAINVYASKVALGWRPCMGDIEWTVKKGSFYPVIGGLAGLFGGLLGIGGGMIVSPLLLELGVLPRVAAATSAIAVAVTSSSTTIQVYLVHMLRLDYALFFMLVGMVSTYIGQTAVNHMITKYGRHSVVVFAVAGVITLAVLLMGIEGIIEIATGEAKFHFSKPC